MSYILLTWDVLPAWRHRGLARTVRRLPAAGRTTVLLAVSPLP